MQRHNFFGAPVIGKEEKRLTRLQAKEILGQKPEHFWGELGLTLAAQIIPGCIRLVKQTSKASPAVWEL